MHGYVNDVIEFFPVGYDITSVRYKICISFSSEETSLLPPSLLVRFLSFPDVDDGVVGKRDAVGGIQFFGERRLFLSEAKLFGKSYQQLLPVCSFRSH